MFVEDSHSEDFYSKHDWWATGLVWGIALIMWCTGIIMLFREGALEGRIIWAFGSLLIGLCVVWLWATTKYRVSGRSLHLQSGPFHKEIKLSEIKRVTYTRKGRGLSFAFSQDALQIDIESSKLGYQVSPQDRRGFVAALAKRCDHLTVQGEGLVPRL
jgi:hypothetical protein